MTRRLARPFAIAGLLLAIVGAVASITLRLADPVPIVKSTFGFTDAALVGFEILGVTFAGVGALLVVRRPGNAVGWCMVLIGTAYALSGLAAAATFSAAADGPAGAEVARIAAWFTVVFTTIGGLVFVLGFIFPTGRGHTPEWDRAILAGAIAAPVIVAILFLFRPGSLHTFESIDNPFGFGPDLRPIFGPQMSSLVAASSLIFVPILAWSMASRYRMSGTVERQQMKWVIAALLVALVAVIVTSVATVVSDDPPEIGLTLFGFAGALVPIAMGIAILRHGLYDIDRIISRTVGYAVVTGVLLIVFAGVIVVVTSVLKALAEGFIPAGQGQTIAVATSTLVVFALFQPIRRRVQAAVDRRFDRAHYDAGQTVLAFTDRLRYDVDLVAVEHEIVDTASVAVRPTRATVWLRGAHR